MYCGNVNDITRCLILFDHIHVNVVIMRANIVVCVCVCVLVMADVYICVVCNMLASLCE